MKNVEDVLFEREQLEFEVDALLRRNGWKNTSNNPCHIWLWEKTLVDGRTVLVNKSTALNFLQEEINASCICTEEDTEEHGETCPARGES